MDEDFLSWHSANTRGLNNNVTEFNKLIKKLSQREVKYLFLDKH